MNYRHLCIGMVCLLWLSMEVGGQELAMQKESSPEAKELSPVEAECAQSLTYIDLSHPGLKKAKALADKRQYQAALGAWRDHVVYRLRAMDAGHFRWHPHQGYSGHQARCLKIMESNDISRGHFNNLNFGPLMNFRYWKTKDDSVVTRWFSYMDQGASKRWIQDNDSWDVGFYSIKSMAAFAKLLPDDQPQQGWADVLRLRKGTVTPQGLELFPPQQLLRIAKAIVIDWTQGPRGFAQFAKAGRAPNQRLGGLHSVLLGAVAFDTLKGSVELQEKIGDAILDVAQGAFHRDGGNLEQSFNYNFGDAKVLLEFPPLFPGKKPTWCRQVEDTAERFYHLMSSLTTPWGGIPRVGNWSGTNPGSLWRDPKARSSWNDSMLKKAPDYVKHQTYGALSRQILTSLFSSGKTPCPSFTSAAFPYSGYYALRGGWNWDSPYAFFMGARPGRGHSMRDHNGLQLAAFGRRMIVNAGPGTYGFGTMSEEVRHYFDEGSMYKCNVINVNGQRQAHVKGVAIRTHHEPIALRWHSSDQFDLVEGLHDTGYGGDLHAYRKDKKVTDTSISHLRQLLFVRGNNPLWIVTDRMLSTRPDKVNTYTQMWHFPPPSAAGFSQDQVVTDQKRRVIRTIDPQGPNISLHHFASQPITYTTYYGKETSPALGWYAQGLGSGITPAVDLHVQWEGSGNQAVVTVLSPSRTGKKSVVETEDLSTGETSGCRIVLADGRTVYYLAGKEVGTLELPLMTARASALMAVYDAQGVLLNGMVLDAQSLHVRKKAVALPLADLRFTQGDSREVHTAPIFKRLIPTVTPVGTAYTDFAYAQPLTLSSPRPDLSIRYTLDGSDPDENSAVYVSPIALSEPCVLKMRLAKGKLLYPDIVTESYRHLKRLRAAETVTEKLENGLRYAYYEAEPNSHKGWVLMKEAVRANAPPKKSGILDYFSSSPVERNARRALVFTGYLQVPRDGIYHFRSPGLTIYIHNSELESATSISLGNPGQIALKAGLHSLRVTRFYFWNGKEISDNPIEISGPGVSLRPLPKEWLWRKSN